MKNLSEKIWCLKVPDVHVLLKKSGAITCL